MNSSTQGAGDAKKASSVAALKVVVMALEEVQSFNGSLPHYEDENAPESFLELVKSYAGDRHQESHLVAAVEAVEGLFPVYQFRWI